MTDLERLVSSLDDLNKTSSVIFPGRCLLQLSLLNLQIKLIIVEQRMTWLSGLEKEGQGMKALRRPSRLSRLWIRLKLLLDGSVRLNISLVATKNLESSRPS